jgi:hypothetical protein
MVYSAANVTANRLPREGFSRETLDVVAEFNRLDLELYRAAQARFEHDVAAQPVGFAIDAAALGRANACLAAAPADAELDRLQVGSDGTSGDIRELLIDARASLLLRDAEIERLRPRSRLPPHAPAKSLTTAATRASALDAAAARAKRRIELTHLKLEELQRAGEAPDSPEIEALRRQIAHAKTRLENFKQRRARLGDPEAPARPR